MSSELEKIISKENVNVEKIFNISSKIDKEVLFQSKFNEYNQILRETTSRSHIKEIQKNILAYYKDISKKEATILSLIVFDYSYLTIHHISPDDIVRYICTKNVVYYDMLTIKELKRLTLPSNLRYFSHLINKYINIIENEQ